MYINPPPRAGRATSHCPVLVPIVGLQHPLSFYDAFAGGVR
jgi:hypothetical protein